MKMDFAKKENRVEVDVKEKVSIEVKKNGMMIEMEVEIDMRVNKVEVE